MRRNFFTIATWPGDYRLIRPLTIAGYREIAYPLANLDPGWPSIVFALLGPDDTLVAWFETLVSPGPTSHRWGRMVYPMDTMGGFVRVPSLPQKEMIWFIWTQLLQMPGADLHKNTSRASDGALIAVEDERYMAEIGYARKTLRPTTLATDISTYVMLDAPLPWRLQDDDFIAWIVAQEQP